MNRKQRRTRKKHVSVESETQLAQQKTIFGLREKFADALRNHQTGNLSRAEQLYQEILKVDARHADALHLRGVLAYQIGCVDEAVNLISEAITILSDQHAFHSNLGLAFHAQGKLVEAVASFERSLAIRPDYAEAHNNHGIVLQEQGDSEGAAASYEKALIFKPDFAAAHTNVGTVLLGQGRLEDAAISFERALFFQPDYAEAQLNLGHALRRQGKLEQAAALYRGAISHKSNYADAYVNLGGVLHKQGKLAEAISSYEQALHYKPDHAQAHSNLANALQSQGKLNKAKVHYEKAISLDPNFVDAHSNFLFCLTHDATTSIETLFVEHCRFSDRFERTLQSDWQLHSNSRDQNRPLQIGFVSGDLYEHPVSRLILPVLDVLAANGNYTMHAYYNNDIEDHMTRRLRDVMNHWNGISHFSDDVLAKKIRADQIDILFDLSGHTARNRLLTFARKPAPVQVSWLGYPATTGLRAIDYYLADRHLAPIGAIDRCFTEAIVRLPSVCRFQPHPDSPDVSRLPALRNNLFTFGSLNRNSKLGNEVIALWSRVLNLVPNSRMVLGGIHDEESQNALIGQFAQHGIAANRLALYPRLAMLQYLRLHNEIDLMLDTFPYSGGTTSGHAVWMGVPVLTLVGEGLASRQTASLLYPAGLAEFVAESEDAFVEKAAHWTRNMYELDKIRTSIRSTITASPLMDASLIARGLEQALKIMWKRWCENLPVERFEIA